MVENPKIKETHGVHKLKVTHLAHNVAKARHRTITVVVQS
jgi:hypothetical protein